VAGHRAIRAVSGSTRRRAIQTFRAQAGLYGIVEATAGTASARRLHMDR